MHLLKIPLVKFSSTLPCCFNELSTRWFREENTIPVILSSYRLVSGQRASLETVPPLRRTKLADIMVVCPGPYPWYQFLHSSVTIQSVSACRYMEHHILVTTEGSFLRSFPAWFSKILTHHYSAPRQFRLCGRSQSFASFYRQRVFLEARTECTEKNPEKARFQVS